MFSVAVCRLTDVQAIFGVEEKTGGIDVDSDMLHSDVAQLTSSGNCHLRPICSAAVALHWLHCTVLNVPPHFTKNMRSSVMRLVGGRYILSVFLLLQDSCH